MLLGLTAFWGGGVVGAGEGGKMTCREVLERLYDKGVSRGYEREGIIDQALSELEKQDLTEEEIKQIIGKHLKYVKTGYKKGTIVLMSVTDLAQAILSTQKQKRDGARRSEEIK